MMQRVLGELSSLSFSDVRKLYSDDGRLKPIKEWPEDVAKMVVGIDVEEAKYDDEGVQIKGEIKKVKMVDKLRAIEMIGKNLRMFVDKVEVVGKLSLEQLVVSSIPKETGDTEQENTDAEEAKT